MSLNFDVSEDEKLAIMVHADNQPDSSPIELEKVANLAEGVFVVDHEDYNGPEITVTIGSEGESDE